MLSLTMPYWGQTVRELAAFRAQAALRARAWSGPVLRAALAPALLLRAAPGVTAFRPSVESQAPASRGVWAARAALSEQKQRH